LLATRPSTTAQSAAATKNNALDAFFIALWKNRPFDCPILYHIGPMPTHEKASAPYVGDLSVSVGNADKRPVEDTPSVETTDRSPTNKPTDGLGVKVCKERKI
jgi:hypothetical protein